MEVPGMTSNRRHICSLSVDSVQLKRFILHFGLLLCVAVYTVVGACIIRNIEAVKIGLISQPTSLDAVLVHQLQDSTDLQRNNSKIKRPLSRSRKCVIQTILNISSGGRCDIYEKKFFDNFHQCYASDLRTSVRMFLAEEYTKSILGNTVYKPRSKATAYREVHNDWEYWTLKDSIIFCFTVITTIGYGHVAPETTTGRLFVILYGFIGIPITMLVIANIGKFLAQLLRYLLRLWRRFYRSSHPLALCSLMLGKICGDGNRSNRQMHYQEKPNYTELNSENTERKTGESQGVGEEEHFNGEPLALLLAFVLYVFAGSLIISLYEPNMDFVKAIYFNFITLMTIGLGDVVPQNETYLAITLVYCIVGLALTTCAVETGANYLRKLHYFGRKIHEVENLEIWFGSKRLTIKQLVDSMGEHFQLPVDKLDKLNLDHFVEQAIQVESGNISTLRKASRCKKPVLIASLHSPTDDIIYIDQD